MIDESGQSTEPDSWIPIGGLVGPQTSVILAGDPKQLGPVVNVALLKRLGYNISVVHIYLCIDFNQKCLFLFPDDQKAYLLRCLPERG